MITPNYAHEDPKSIYTLHAADTPPIQGMDLRFNFGTIRSLPKPSALRQVTDLAHVLRREGLGSTSADALVALVVTLKRVDFDRIAG